MAEGGERVQVDFRTEPGRYKHWRLSLDGRVATLAMDVREDGGLRPGYELKLNSYDLGVDIELYDAVQRLRFEHPEVGAVILRSAKERVFCAGANIRMLGQSTHGWKVNFCKFTNETRNAIEEASAESGQAWVAAVNGPCAGGGYELALACERIVMADDGNTSVALPEVPLLAVLPGTGGLTRLIDKRKVRRDRADFFCTLEEGIKGKRAVEWSLVDEVVPRSRLEERVRQRRGRAGRSHRSAGGCGAASRSRRWPARRGRSPRVSLGDLRRSTARRGLAEITVAAPDDGAAGRWRRRAGAGRGVLAAGRGARARRPDPAPAHQRGRDRRCGSSARRERPIGSRPTTGCSRSTPTHWLVREIRLYLKRTLKRLDVTSRSIFALIEPGSCFAGTLLELALAADRSYMLDGEREGDDRPAPTRPPDRR